MEFFLFFFFSFNLLLSSFIVAFIAIPVNAVFFLVLAFCNAAGLFILLGAEFLSLLFLVVYIGAIAILFLFVIIILNLKEQNMPLLHNFIFVILMFFVFLFLFCELAIIISVNFINVVFFKFFPSINYVEWTFLQDSLFNIEIFGTVLFNSFFLHFLLAGFVLLVAMFGSIVLTFQKRSKIKSRELQRQFVFEQLSRLSTNAVFLLKKV